MLIPVACNFNNDKSYAAFLAIIELDLMSDDGAPVESYTRVHRIQYDELENNALKGDLKAYKDRLEFEPTKVRIDQRAGAVLVYGPKGSMIANTPGKRENNRFREANKGQDMPI